MTSLDKRPSIQRTLLNVFLCDQIRNVEIGEIIDLSIGRLFNRMTDYNQQVTRNHWIRAAPVEHKYPYMRPKSRSGHPLTETTMRNLVVMLDTGT
ncbi:jg3830 [Pararge aegeria aegeria]|uniref:Jg3830 protein n=1 Tax=Pararge aegeria aegeria TaxID=348720 RepID=A0A8S4RJ54_9NEOP|nr:jg3830 [Pararge aegeria aegeria]